MMIKNVYKIVVILCCSYIMKQIYIVLHIRNKLNLVKILKKKQYKVVLIYIIQILVYLDVLMPVEQHIRDFIQ